MEQNNQVQVDNKPITQSSVLEPKFSEIEKPKIMNEINLEDQKKQLYITIFASVIVLLLGVGTGFKLSRYTSADSGSSKVAGVADEVANTAEESLDSDQLIGEGVLTDGGVDGQGRYTLELEDGEEIALISSLIPLESFVDKQVEIWGENISQTDLQLVDVTKVKVLK